MSLDRIHVLIRYACSSFSGVVLVSLSDSAQPQTSGPGTESVDGSQLQSLPLLGDALALLSALFYALYVTLLKVRIRSESRIDMQLFFGFVGLFNILACWPIGVILHLTGVEPFEMPSTGRAVTALLVNVSICTRIPVHLWPDFDCGLTLSTNIDGHHTLERLHLCDRHAQDYALGSHCGAQPYDAARRHGRLLPRPAREGSGCSRGGDRRVQLLGVRTRRLPPCGRQPALVSSSIGSRGGECRGSPS